MRPTGLKKCRPTTRPGFVAVDASSSMGSADVFEANTQSGAAIFVSSANSFRLAAVSSMMASITRSQISKSSRLVVMPMPPVILCASSWVSWPRFTASAKRPRMTVTACSIASFRSSQRMTP